MADDQLPSTNVCNLCDGCVVGACELDRFGTRRVISGVNGISALLGCYSA